MSLITCPECGNQISSTAKACPSCGFTHEKARVLPPVLIVFFSTIALIVAAILFWIFALLFIFKSGLILPEWSIFAVTIAMIFGAVILAVTKRIRRLNN